LIPKKVVKFSRAAPGAPYQERRLKARAVTTSVRLTKPAAVANSGLMPFTW
jgi:hypothetical protein